jgi:hypothetical protein
MAIVVYQDIFGVLSKHLLDAELKMIHELELFDADEGQTRNPVSALSHTQKSQVTEVTQWPQLQLIVDE